MLASGPGTTDVSKHMKPKAIATGTTAATGTLTTSPMVLTT